MAVETKDRDQIQRAEEAEQRAEQARLEAEQARLEADQERSRREWQEARGREREEQVAAEVARREAELVRNRAQRLIEHGAAAYSYWADEGLRGGQAKTPVIDFLAVAAHLEVADATRAVADRLAEIVELLKERPAVGSKGTLRKVAK